MNKSSKSLDELKKSKQKEFVGINNLDIPKLRTEDVLSATLFYDEIKSRFKDTLGIETNILLKEESKVTENAGTDNPSIPYSDIPYSISTDRLKSLLEDFPLKDSALYAIPYQDTVKQITTIYNFISEITPGFTSQEPGILGKISLSRIGVLSVFENKNKSCVFFDLLLDNANDIKKKIVNNKSKLLKTFKNYNQVIVEAKENRLSIMIYNSMTYISEASMLNLIASRLREKPNTEYNENELIIGYLKDEVITPITIDMSKYKLIVVENNTYEFNNLFELLESIRLSNLYLNKNRENLYIHEAPKELFELRSEYSVLQKYIDLSENKDLTIIIGINTKESPNSFNKDSSLFRAADLVLKINEKNKKETYLSIVENKKINPSKEEFNFYTPQFVKENKF